ncbi:MAG: tetratricopeptide repeat protein [Deltaproteobacteria bacterium]|nr:tetratricopeptide repeat protein [Deltaproteobacteria bacterium]
MHKFLVFNVAFFLLLYANGDAHAVSPGELVNKGNRAYAEEKYDDALSSYKDALKEEPDSSRIFFNKGTAYYKKSEFDNAADAFEKSAAIAEDETIEAKARFNHGNASFRKAESLIPSDLNSALENCKKSTNYYRDALELKPDFREAAENIETVRYTIKSILDQMEQQKKQSEEKNQDQSKDSEEKKPGQSNEPEDKADKPESQDSREEEQSGNDRDPNQNQDQNQDQNKAENGKQKKSMAKESDKKPKDISDMLKEDAESILDEEKKNKEHRRAKISGKFSGPDRDW